MKKLIIAGLVIVIAVGAIVVLSGTLNKSSDKNTSVVKNETSNDTKGKTACELLTLEDAKSLIGENATQSEDTGSPNLATTENGRVDNCTYSADGSNLGGLKMLTIQVQFGDKDQVKQAYENYQKEYPGETLPNLGDAAYFATGAKQVNVLKGEYWILAAGGSLNDDDNAIKDLELKTAQRALEKL